jgi:acid stress chaperone HdeB
MIGWRRPGTATINPWLLSIVVALAVVFGETAHAGLTVDITKVTCRRASFIGSTTTSANSVALWLVGYYSAQHGRTVIDIATMERDADRIKRYCRVHRDETIMKAAETVLGTEP